MVRGRLLTPGATTQSGMVGPSLFVPPSAPPTLRSIRQLTCSLHAAESVDVAGFKFASVTVFCSNGMALCGMEAQGKGSVGAFVQGLKS